MVMGKKANGVTEDFRAMYRDQPICDLSSSTVFRLGSLEGGTVLGHEF